MGARLAASYGIIKPVEPYPEIEEVYRTAHDFAAVAKYRDYWDKEHALDEFCQRMGIGTAGLPRGWWLVSYMG